MKKVLSLFLSSIIMIASVLSIPFVGYAEGEEKPSNWQSYVFNSYYDEEGNWLIDDSLDYVKKSDGTLKIVDFYPGLDYYSTPFEIPSHLIILDYNTDKTYIAGVFNEIDKYSFRGTNIRKYIIPDTIEILGTYSFADNEYLNEIKMPNNLKIIGDGVFENCNSLEEITIPDSVTKMGNGVFSNCSSIKKIHFSKKVKNIPTSTFKNCKSLKSFTVPNQVIQIKSKAFSGCSSLSKISFSKNTTEIGSYAFENCKALKTITIPKNVKKINSKAFGYYYDSKTCGYKKYKNVTIKGYTNTAAEKYAKKNKIKFSSSVLKTPAVKITAGKKKINVKYTKVSGASGFQVKYTKGKKTITKTFKSAKSVTKSIAKLKKGKYKVQVRAYYKNDKNQKAFSPWTKVKTVNVK